MSHLCRLRTGFGIKVGSEDDVQGADCVRVRHQLQRRTGRIRLRDRPDRPVAAGTMLTRLATTLHMPVTLRLSFLVPQPQGVMFEALSLVVAVAGSGLVASSPV
jgi:hypothetical protein